MKRFILITASILTICAAMFHFIALPHKVSGVKAHGGVLDLTGAQDLADTLYTLDGEWEFYYGKLYVPDDFAHVTPSDAAPSNAAPSDGAFDAAFIEVPLSWHRQGYPRSGYATYRLTILTGETELFMFVPQIVNSSVIWVNGEKVFEAGKVGMSGVDTIQGTRNAFVSVRPENARAEIVIQAANFNFVASGLMYEIQLGRRDVLTRDVMTRRVALAFALGVFLAMGLYHIILFMQSRREWAYLAFSLVCLFAFVRFLFNANGFADMLLPNGVGAAFSPWLMALLILHMAALLVFAHTVFSIPVKGRVRRAVYACSFIGSAMFLIPGAPLTLAYLVLVPVVCVAISAARSKRLRENRYNMLFLFALIVYILWYPLNILLAGHRLFSPGIVPNMFLVLSQCVILVMSYAQAKRMSDELSEKNVMLGRLARMKNEFFQNVSHDLKTPLTVISTDILNAADSLEFNSLEFDMDRGDELEEIRASLSHAQSEIMRMARIIDGVMKYSCMQDSKQGVEPLDMAKFLREGSENYRALLSRNGNALELDIPETLPLITGNSDTLLHVLANLLSNANRHTRNGSISISALSDGGMITVKICDTGCGIKPELLPDIDKRGVSDGGTGLGLSICKEIIESYNGNMTIESKPGEGTSVTFTLPSDSGEGHQNG